MKSYFITLFLCLLSLCSAKPLKDKHLDRAQVKQLVKLLDGDPKADLIQETQRSWLRPKGKERWQMVSLPKDKQKEVITWAYQVGLYSAWQPVENRYDKAVVLGATTGHMKKRLLYLKTVYGYFRRLSKLGVWEKVLKDLVKIKRMKSGRNEHPSLMIVDAQSVKTAGKGEKRGFDGGKKNQRS